MGVSPKQPSHGWQVLVSSNGATQRLFSVAISRARFRDLVATTSAALPRFRAWKISKIGQSIDWLLFFLSMFNWLVVSIPLKNISQLGWLFPIYGKNVPNHQPDWIEYDSTCSSCLLLVNKKPLIFYLISPNKWRSPVEFPPGLETSQEDRQFKSCRIPPNTATNNLLNFFGWYINIIYIYWLLSTLLHHPNPIWKLYCLHMSNAKKLYIYNTL